MKWILLLLLGWGAARGAAARGGPRYWDADYDSLARALPRQRTDPARRRTLVHLLDLHPTNAQALPFLDQLLALSQQLPPSATAPYRRLRAGLAQWQQGPADAAALDTLKAAVAAFDRLGRPIPWLLLDLVTFYNRLNAMAARKRYYDERLVEYRLRGATENTAACYASQGAYYRRMGDYHRTLNYTLRAADLALGFSRKIRTNELIVSGAVYADWGNVGKAVQYLSLARGLPEFRRVQGTNRVFTFLALSKLYLQLHQYPAALRAADSALAARVSDPAERHVNRAHGLVQRAAVLLHMNQAAAAGPLLRRAQQLDDSLRVPLAGKPGEFELDATRARYYAARRDYARAETHWQRALQKATAAKLDRLRPRYLQQLAAFYDDRGRPAVAEGYSRAYRAQAEAFEAQQSVFHVAQYESERMEQAQHAQIADLRQRQAVQAVRLRLSKRQLLGALLAVLLVSGLGAFIFRQLQVNRRTLARLREAQAQLVQAEKMAFLGELTAGIAHELQNPLNFMKNFAEVSTGLVDDMNGDGPGRAGLTQEIMTGLKQNLRQISQHGQRASSIIRDMLEHSRVGGGHRAPADLNALLQESLTLAHQGMGEPDPSRPVAFVTDFDPALGPVAVAGPDLGRALLNLCTNALYAVRQRGQRGGPLPAAYVPTVTVRTRCLPGRGVEIRIGDNGTGMSAAVRQQVFEPFFTTKPAGEGTGLGLSLARDIVTKGHGGTLTVESREDEGSEFVITLPG